MWHLSSRSAVATLRTAIHLLLTYLLTYAAYTDSTLQTVYCILAALKGRIKETYTRHHAYTDGHIKTWTGLPVKESIRMTDTHRFNGPFFRDYPGEPVPER